jgi:hypothetical protein
MPSCQSSGNEDTGDHLLAQAHNKKLYLSEMDGMFPEGTTSEDSAATIRAYVQRWLRDALLQHEAEVNLPPDLNIDKLVRIYRASLITHNYEVALAQELLDSTISQAELNDFYEKNKEQYQLETPIMRCHFIKVKLPVPDADNLRKFWNGNKPEDLKNLIKYCNENGAVHILEDSIWYDLNDIAVELPEGTLTADNVSYKRDFTQRDANFQYYFRLFESKNRKDIAPLSYIEGQARKVILHNRKIKLLSDTKEELYDREMRRGNIHIYDIKQD